MNNLNKLKERVKLIRKELIEGNFRYKTDKLGNKLISEPINPDIYAKLKGIFDFASAVLPYDKNSFVVMQKRLDEKWDEPIGPIISVIDHLLKLIEMEENDKFKKPMDTKEKFITLKHSDYFYQKLEDEINLCYTYGAYTAVLILSRKLIENLLIDVLRNKYGNKTKSAREVYYREDKHRFHDFTRLLENLEGKKDDFKVDKDTFEKFISSVEPFRKGANSKAHSIVNLIEKKEELEKFNVQDLASLLMRLENFNKK
ncbi:MAG: hypothetical protein CVT88_01400 [Candidatus Altiarchaeales archaeon HGW-Altiarchaeales-1]|nr:MAG: hypothetical protein CVT88_01400 [Candidatus Altiarchaeales archaeon HGW-Altiarchaeales-1]